MNAGFIYETLKNITFENIKSFIIIIIKFP